MLLIVFPASQRNDDEEIGSTEPLVKMQSNCSRECCTGTRTRVELEFWAGGSKPNHKYLPARPKASLILASSGEGQRQQQSAMLHKRITK